MITTAFERIQNLTDAHSSPLLAGYLLIGDIRTVGACVLAYLYMCLMGPRFMKDRKEVHLKPLMQVYNVFMVALNAWVLYELTMTSLDRNWLCEPVSHEKNDYNMRHAFAMWVYYLSKVVEFLDTLFFILRKKFEHVSFLHVYHHSSMCLSMWSIATFVPTGDAFFPVYCNAMVHVVMYSYYFIAAHGPQYQRYIWWKRHLTKFQIFQFFMIMFQAIASACLNCNPVYAHFHYYIVGYMSSFVILFGQFYLIKYIQKGKQDTKSDKPKKIE